MQENVAPTKCKLSSGPPQREKKNKKVQGMVGR